MYTFSLEGLTPIKPESYPFTEFQLKWLEALESGKWKQGAGWLKDYQGGYCCLGVACELAGYYSEIKFGQSGYDFKRDKAQNYGAQSYLPDDLMKEMLLRDHAGEFENPVQFPGIGYGAPAVRAGMIHTNSFEATKPGHGSLAAMNDARVLATEDDMRTFNFKEIASYIRFDPWNVFLAAA